MGFHKRHIDNQQVISLFKSGGIENVIKWYTGKADALILETGLASTIHDILMDDEWSTFGKAKTQEHLIKLIQKELGVNETLT
mgnify:FL=1|tara:strand:- start:561 stop:809 length:249 start_codon:yes stop_codon:yes gene_type:complete